MRTEFIPVNKTLFSNINLVKQVFIFLSWAFVQYNGENLTELIHIQAQLTLMARLIYLK